MTKERDKMRTLAAKVVEEEGDAGIRERARDGQERGAQLFLARLHLARALIEALLHIIRAFVEVHVAVLVHLDALVGALVTGRHDRERALSGSCEHKNDDQLACISIRQS